MSVKHRVVLISGKQGSGKSTTANGLVEKLVANGYPQTRIFKFAGPLYEMHDAVLEVLGKYGIKRPDLVKDGPLLQVLGTEWGRSTVDTNIWVKCAQNTVQNWFDRRPYDSAIAILDDCRFENEFDAFPEALKVRLECSAATRQKRCSMWRENQKHPSETGLDMYAELGKFDVVYETEYFSTGGIIEDLAKRLMY